MPAPLQRFVHKPDEKRQLEHCIEKAMMDLLSKCMFGGIMITYNAPDFPLYYIDEQMLSLLNYPSQTDLIAAVGKAMINCLRPEDRENVQAEIAQALLSGNNYTTAYRMLCRDKGYIWVKETGVQTVLHQMERPYWSAYAWISPAKWRRRLNWSPSFNVRWVEFSVPEWIGISP